MGFARPTINTKFGFQPLYRIPMAARLHLCEHRAALWEMKGQGIQFVFQAANPCRRISMICSMGQRLYDSLTYHWIYSITWSLLCVFSNVIFVPCLQPNSVPNTYAWSLILCIQRQALAGQGQLSTERHLRLPCLLGNSLTWHGSWIKCRLQGTSTHILFLMPCTCLYDTPFCKSDKTFRYSLVLRIEVYHAYN